MKLKYKKISEFVEELILPPLTLTAVVAVVAVVAFPLSAPLKVGAVTVPLKAPVVACIVPPLTLTAVVAVLAVLAVAAFPTIVFVTVRLVTLAVEILLFAAVSFVMVAVFAVKLSIADVPETVSFVIVAFVIVAVGVVKLAGFVAIPFSKVTLLIVPPTTVVLGDRSEVCE